MATVKEERRKVAKYRFHLYILKSPKPGDYCYSILDEEEKPKTIAKFRILDDAESFLSIRREKYIKTGI